MATTKSSKATKRKARDDDIAIAAELAREFWELERVHAVTGDDLRSWAITAACALRRFAESGSFSGRISASKQAALIKNSIAEMRASGMKPNAAIAAMADALDLDLETVKGYLYRRLKPKS